MPRSGDETRPLLSSQEAASISSNRTKSDHRFVTALDQVRRHWPILRLLSVAALWGCANYGAAASYLDGLRSFTCAYTYSKHPELLPTEPHPKLPHDRDRPCAISGVESKVGLVVAIATMLTFAVSSISMLFYGPRLSKWGRKPMLIISLCSHVLQFLPFALLPLGYPYGDIPSQLSISPAGSMFVLLICSFVSGLTGFAALFLCTMRVMVVDVVSPTRRTVSLNWLISATLVGGFFGPLLAAWALQTSVKPRKRPPLPHLYGEAFASFELPSDPSAPLPLPDAPQFRSKHGNPAALVACCWVFFVAISFTLLLVPETRPATHLEAAPHPSPSSNAHAAEARGEFSSNEDAEHAVHSASVSPSRLRAFKVLGPLSIYLPQVTQDGRSDYRLTLLALAGAFSSIGTSALQYVAIFAGYKFDFTPDAIGVLLGLIGASRAVWLILCIPLLVLFFERSIRKPSLIAQLSKEELEALAKTGLQDPDLKQADSCDNQEPDTHGLAHRTEHDAHHEGGPRATEASTETIRAAVLWRTKIDVAIAKVSYAADVVGYLVVLLSASFSSAAAMISGTLFLSFGAGAGPAVASAAIAVIQDMKRSGHPTLDPTIYPNPTDAWLAALSISDNIVNGVSPVLMSLVYSLTIETALPSTCFLIPTVGYVISFALLAMVRIRGAPAA